MSRAFFWRLSSLDRFRSPKNCSLKRVCANASAHFPFLSAAFASRNLLKRNWLTW